MAEFTSAPWCIPPGSETCVCAGDDGAKPGEILFVLHGPSGTREIYSHELLSEYSAHIAKAVNSHGVLVKALGKVANASQSEATSRIRRIAQEALASLGIPEHQLAKTAERAREAAVKVSADARVDSSTKRIPMGLSPECEHDWKIWPETDGQEQRCMKCGKYRKTPSPSAGGASVPVQSQSE